MPIYEYRCTPCEHTFETLMRSSTDATRCPRCGNDQVAKQFSVPAAAHTGSPSSSLPVCNTGPAPGSFGCGGGGCGSGLCSMD